MIKKGKGKSKFIVLAQLDEKSPIEILTTKAENRDVAHHQVEIANGCGTFIVLDKRQARRIFKDLKNWLKDHYVVGIGRATRRPAGEH